MPPRKIVDTTVYIMDCSQSPGKKLNYLFKIFASKFFAQTKSAGEDLQKVIYFNRPKSNPVEIINDWQAYHLDNLVLFPHDFEDADISTNQGTIVDALSAAVKCFDDEHIENHHLKKIVFITDLDSPMTCDDNTWVSIEDINMGLEKHQIWLYVVGPNVQIQPIACEQDVFKLRKNITPSEKFTENQTNNVKVLEEIFENINGIVANYDVGFDLIFSYKPQGKPPFASYVDMSIGESLKIAVSVSKTTRDREKIPFKSSDDVEPNTTNSSWVDFNRMAPAESSDVISGYMRHNKHVFFNPGQEENMDKNDYSKCLSIFSFCNAKEISTELFILPDSIHVLSADTRKNNEAIKPLQKFITALRMRNKVALAIRIYNNGNNPNLFCIFPCPEHDALNSSCLLMGELPYEHCIKHEFILGGHVGKLATGDVEEKSCAYGYFEAMGIENLKGKAEILPEHMRLNRSALCKYMYFASQNLDQTPDTPSELSAHPILVKLREEYVKMVPNIWPEMEKVKEEFKDEMEEEENMDDLYEENE